MAWTEPQKAAVKTRINSGEHPITIAPDFNTTPNAIRGLCDRNGWTFTPKPRSPRVHNNPQVPRGPGYQINRTIARRMSRGGKNYMHKIQVSEAETVFSTAAFDAAIPVEQRKTFAQLGPRDCRWPVGDVGSPDFFFCGAVTLDDRSYCFFHHRASVQPPRDRSAGQFEMEKWKTTFRAS